MVVFVVDSSTIISCATNCVLWIFDELKKQGFEFFMPKGVEGEIVASGLRSKKFKYEAIRVLTHFSNGTFKTSTKDVRLKARELLDNANSLFRTKGRYIKILQEADAEVAALAKEINADGILTDERTLRLLIERPESLHGLMQHRLHTKLQLNKDSLYKFRDNVGNIPVFRSADLMALAIKNGVFDNMINTCTNLNPNSRKDVIEGALYSLRFAGCGISFEELNEYVTLLLKK